MSEDERSDSSSDEEDLDTTGLIATRAKRVTAGNLYATIIQNIDDEELKQELLAEDEEDAEDYEGSDRDGGDDDEALDSSSEDDEDAGPPKEGEAEDLEGEKELKKAERAESRRKRKAEQAKMRVPAWQKKKRVKLADDVKVEDGSSSAAADAAPKKKSERANWLPTAADGPRRQSARALAVANREITHAHLVQSAARAERQRSVMKHAVHREKANRRAQLTQEERLLHAAKIEKETMREFGRWEREEAERQRIREEQLAAKRRRYIDGPFVRHWSGSVLWEGDKIKVQRMHGFREGEVSSEESKTRENDAGAETGEAMDITQTSKEGISFVTDDPNTIATDGPVLPEIAEKSRNTEAAADGSSSALQRHTTSDPDQAGSRLENPTQPSTASQQHEQETHSSVPLLDGIEAYAAKPVSGDEQPLESSEAAQKQTQTLPATHQPATEPALAENQASEREVPQQQLQTSATADFIEIPDRSNAPPAPQHIQPNWPPGYLQFPLQPTQILPPAEPIAPLVREQARRSLVMLEQFENLESSTSSHRRSSAKAAKDPTLEPTPLASKLLPSSHPRLTAEQTRYLTGKLRKRAQEHLLPPPPVKPRCALTCWPAKFMDPKTGLPYADLPTYKMIQRLLAGGCAWSGFLGAWVGPAYGKIGRPAKGVPEGFGAPCPSKTDLVSSPIREETRS